jgi:hypothetical protein
VNRIEHASPDADLARESTMRKPAKVSKVTSESLVASEVDR